MSQDIPGLKGFVVREIKSADCTSSELYQKSLRRYPEVAGLTVQQFHARYVLPMRKELKRPSIRLFPLPRPQTKPMEPMVEETPEQPAMTDREAIRLLLLRLAMDFETSESPVDVVDVFARLDSYVDEGMAIVGD